LKNDDSELSISSLAGSLIPIGKTLDSDDPVAFNELGADTPRKLDELASDAGNTTDDRLSDSVGMTSAFGRMTISRSRTRERFCGAPTSSSGRIPRGLAIFRGGISVLGGPLCRRLTKSTL
jgi:hypothetical protein